MTISLIKRSVKGSQLTASEHDSNMTAIENEVNPAIVTADIADDAVDNAKLANMAAGTYKMRVTASTGSPEDATAAQATAGLNVVTTALKGLAPASGGGTTNFLRADATWAAPAGGGGSSDSEGITYLAPYTGSVSRTVENRLSEVVSANDFSGTATQRIHAAAAACVGTSKTLLIPTGTWTCSALDLTEVKNIVCEGIIKSTITTGQIAVLVGTVTDTANKMIFGSISIWVEHNNNVNTGLTGTVGVAVRGAAMCEFRIRSLFFETGVSLQPQDGTGTQYISDCKFHDIQTYGCKVGLHFNGFKAVVPEGNGWVNENAFYDIGINGATSTLTPWTGILMSGNGDPPDNNVFHKPHLEGLTVPIQILRGVGNTFHDCRLETAGSILFGDGTTTSGNCANNVVLSNYTQTGLSPDFTHAACFPNLVGGRDGVQWTQVAYVNYDDWKVNGAVASNRSVLRGWNTVSTGRAFSAPTLNSTNRTFKLNAADSNCYVFVPVNVGDVLKVSTDWTGSPAGGTVVFAIVGVDSTNNAPAAIAAGAYPYMGTSDATSLVNGTTGTTYQKDIPVSTYASSRLIVCNRSEVKLIGIKLTNALDYKYLRVERMEWRGAHGDVPSPNFQDAKYVTNFTTEPDRLGQVGVQVTSGEARIAKSHAAWATQLTSTTTALAAIGDAINTTDKYAGKLVFNTTTSKLVVAVGATAAGVWANSGTGVTEHTPV